MSLHTSEQIQTKREAIEIAVQAFVMNYMEGLFENNDPELMYHKIEDLYILVKELKHEELPHHERR